MQPLAIAQRRCGSVFKWTSAVLHSVTATLRIDWRSRASRTAGGRPPAFDGREVSGDPVEDVRTIWEGGKSMAPESAHNRRPRVARVAGRASEEVALSNSFSSHTGGPRGGGGIQENNAVAGARRFAEATSSAAATATSRSEQVKMLSGREGDGGGGSDSFFPDAYLAADRPAPNAKPRLLAQRGRQPRTTSDKRRKHKRRGERRLGWGGASARGAVKETNPKPKLLPCFSVDVGGGSLRSASSSLRRHRQLRRSDRARASCSSSRARRSCTYLVARKSRPPLPPLYPALNALRNYLSSDVQL
ncbi:hypothetical protein HPB50_012091 [Hyalomma asiaticum]|uniref:Uncharacterized protein n=1 Tax=Hyalomma asiaticum TaxID=266040 RepID=A0ACB7SEV6_HYAAI|nr:hypothetical protein HPB50_012091 [Hyalomma asiaticum]